MVNVGNDRKVANHICRDLQPDFGLMNLEMLSSAAKALEWTRQCGLKKMHLNVNIYRQQRLEGTACLGHCTIAILHLFFLVYHWLSLAIACMIPL